MFKYFSVIVVSPLVYYTDLGDTIFKKWHDGYLSRLYCFK